MRQQKAEFKKITFALFAIVLALILIQCIFVVDGVAEAESGLIADYFSFNAPTRIAACGENFAVFDSGRVELFISGAHTSFDTEVTECDKLVLSPDGVFLLTGLSDEDPEILAYSVDGTAKEYVIPSEKVTDISYTDGVVYTLGELLNVKGYTTSDGTLTEDYKLPGMSFSLYFAADLGVSYFRKYDGTIFKREGGVLTTLDSVGEVTVLHAKASKLYYAKDGGIYLLGGDSFLPKANASGDAAFSAVTDFAVGDKVFVLDGESNAVKVYDLSGNYQKMIGAAGEGLGRLSAPIALGVGGGKLLVADALRGSEFSLDTGNLSRVLNGRKVTSPTDVAIAQDAVYLVDKGVLYEYDSTLLFTKDHSYFSSECLFVTASPNGTVYAASGSDIYKKSPGVSTFAKTVIAAGGTISGMTVGIGGNILYVLTGSVISAYAESGVPIARLDTGASVMGFSVDYRGNIFVATKRTILRFERIPQGYGEPAKVADLPHAYTSYGDLAFDDVGNAYVISDHNVLIYSKEEFGVAVKEDGTFTDTVPSEHPRFVCRVVKETAVAYVSPGNFEDITIVPTGSYLMCYAYVTYAGDEYVRAETEQGTVYISVGDVKECPSGEAPFPKARCAIPALGAPVGVNIYEEPSLYNRKKIFTALGTDDVLDVLSVVAVDENGNDVWGYYLVRYEGKEGYVRFEDVASLDAALPMSKTIDMQVKSEGLGKTVGVYTAADLSSEPLVWLSDGSRIKVIEPFDPESEFTAVLYDEKVCYVLTQNVGQNGLSAGQVLAIVLSVVAAVGSVLTILILRANKKHRRSQKE